MAARNPRVEGKAATANLTSLERVSDRELLITRTFNAPPRIVFEAWTKPEFVKRWWAPVSRGVSIVSCDADVRVGGRYRYVLKAPDGAALAFSGSYRQVTPHSQLVYTTFYEPDLVAPTSEDQAAVVTVTFDAEGDDKTRLVAREVYPSKEVLDGVIASGMEAGARETMDLLDELVATLD
jgi:uncharacterized protein YndB with AHSA1/START domain